MLLRLALRRPKPQFPRQPRLPEGTAHEIASFRELGWDTWSDEDIFFLAIARNARHGLILSQADKQKAAIRFCLDNTQTWEEICSALSISERTYRDWTTAARAYQDGERRDKILRLYLRCLTHDKIAELVDISRKEVSREIESLGQSGNSADLTIFRDFEGELGEDSDRRIYDVWNFAKADNEVRHFGNIPPQIIDNLLYLCTKPFDAMVLS